VIGGELFNMMASETTYHTEHLSNLLCNHTEYVTMKTIYAW